MPNDKSFLCPVKTTSKQEVRVSFEECRVCYRQQTETTEYCIHMNKYEIPALERGV